MAPGFKGLSGSSFAFTLSTFEGMRKPPLSHSLSLSLKHTSPDRQAYEHTHTHTHTCAPTCMPTPTHAQMNQRKGSFEERHLFQSSNLPTRYSKRSLYCPETHSSRISVPKQIKFYSPFTFLSCHEIINVQKAKNFVQSFLSGLLFI